MTLGCFFISSREAVWTALTANCIVSVRSVEDMLVV